MISWLAGLATGISAARLSSWINHDRLNHGRVQRRLKQPEQPLAADLIRYSRWRSEQIERALRDQPPN